MCAWLGVVTVTSKNNVDPEGDDSLGVLDDTASSDTSAIGLLGGTAQVSVSLPTGGEDDDLVDDEVVDGEIVSDLIIDTSAVADADTLARIQQDASEIVIELPAEDPQPETGEATTAGAESADETVAESLVAGAVDADVVDADVVDADMVDPDVVDPDVVAESTQAAGVPADAAVPGSVVATAAAKSK